jgi:RNA polymerase-binding protein DksA
MSAIDTKEFQQLLLDERERVAGALEGLQDSISLEQESGEIHAGVDNHLGDTATITYDRELDQTLEENEKHVLDAIDAALQRIEDGTFGTCSTCGKEIGEERLRAMPYATRCIDCKRKEERG